MNTAADAMALRWGALIHAKRNALGWDQVELAEAVGTTQPTISRWEKGKQLPSSRHQAALMRELGIADNELARIYRGVAA